jgi:hypothetical protein
MELLQDSGSGHGRNVQTLSAQDPHPGMSLKHQRRLSESLLMSVCGSCTDEVCTFLPRPETLGNRYGKTTKQFALQEQVNRSARFEVCNEAVDWEH